MALLLVLWLSVLPKGEILIKGAMPSASDASTPVPENGTVSDGRYRNAYFGLTYPVPAGWTEQPAGPPPSDGGSYVLASFATPRTNVLVSAQDLFFSARPFADAKELHAAMRAGLEPQYELEDGPNEVTIGGRTFHRLAYKGPRSGLRWRTFTTDSRCHALTFAFAGTDVPALDAAERALGTLALMREAPACVRDYVRPENIVEKTDPVFDNRRHNTIPVRLLIDAEGRVKHVHVLTAFPDQAQGIISALRAWRFKPAGREIETGIVLGMPR